MTRSSKPALIATLAYLVGMLVITPAKTMAQSAAQEKKMRLSLGEQKVLPAIDVEKFSEGTPGIVDIRLPGDGREFFIVGIKPGTTTLLLLMKNGSQVRYEITVRSDSVVQRDNIRLDFYFVELSRRSASRVGIGWPGTIGGTVNVNANFDLPSSTMTSATASVAAQVLPRLDLAQTTGWAKVAREASVTMANGESGMFETGGELNFRIVNNQSTGIESIKFGSRIEVKPSYDRSTGRLDVTIAIAVSELTEVSLDGLPGRSVTHLSTVVNLELGQSIVLAGIHAQNVGSSSDGLPGLSRIPVFGHLFGSQGGNDSEIENIIFIVPTVIQAIETDELDMVKEALKIFASYDGGDTNGELKELRDKTPDDIEADENDKRRESKGRR